MADYHSAVALWCAAGPGIALRPSDQVEEIAKKLRRDPDLFLVAEDEKEIIGVIVGAWDGRRGWIHHLTVAASHRRLGIGQALLREVENRLCAKGCLKVNLVVRPESAEAIALYRSLGYGDMRPIFPMGKEL